MSMKLPVRFPVKEYNYLDVGAPALENVDGSIKNILKACLIDGYGDKVGAGWELLFDDTFSMMVKMPYVDANAPVLRISNGLCNGVMTHDISSFSNPTSLYGDTPITTAAIMGRDSSVIKEWHLVVTDFVFILCYRMGENGYGTQNRNNLLYVGGVMNMRDSDGVMYIANTSAGINTSTGFGSPWVGALLYSSSIIKNLATGASYNSGANVVRMGLPEKYYNDDYLAHRIFFINNTILPMYCSVCVNYGDVSNSGSYITIDGRPMLRYINRLYQAYGDTVYYIPLDYMEL